MGAATEEETASGGTAAGVALLARLTAAMGGQTEAEDMEVEAPAEA